MMLDVAPRQGTLWGSGSLAPQPADGTWHVLDQASALYHQPLWLHGADNAYESVSDAVEWRSMQRPMYDQIVDVPRLISVEDPGALPCAALRTLVDGVEALLGITTEHLGLNLYRDGSDSVAWHRDRIGRDRDWSVIALVSLGGPRTLSMRRYRPSGTRVHGGPQTRHLELASGDLLVMVGACQRDWEHAVLKASNAGPRISVALRSKQFAQGPLFQQRGVPPLIVDRNLR